MNLLMNLWQTFNHFMQQGGVVLWCLALVMCLSWFLIIERIFVLQMTYRQKKQDWLSQWQARRERSSWYAQAFKIGVLQQAHQMLNKRLNLLKVLVSLCPMLGLLGTVTGMIQVFDAMAMGGSNDPQQMASGISMATLPTMAGMIAALIGMFAYSRLAKIVSRKEQHLEQQLRSNGCA